MARTYPDGSVSPAGVPASTGGSMGSVGGVGADGAAERHTSDTRVPPQQFGWLSGIRGVVGSADRKANPEINIGPSGPLWRKPAGPFTTGMQAKGRRK